MFSLTKALVWKRGASRASARKILLMDASRAHGQADATIGMSIELPPEEQVSGEDLIGELCRHSGHEWQMLLVDNNYEIGCQQLQ